MPAAVVVPAIAAVAGAGAQAYGQHKATKASERSTAAALAFEREREAARRAEYNKAMEAYERRMAAIEQNRNALLARYGVTVAPTSPGMPVRGTSTPILSSPVYATGSPGTQTLQMPAQAQSIRAMIGPQDLGAWNNWERQGLA